MIFKKLKKRQKRQSAKVLLSLSLAFCLCFAPLTGAYGADSTGAGSGPENPVESAVESAVGNGNRSYSPLTLTGSLLQEEEIFHSSDLKTISEEAKLGLAKSGSYEIDGRSVSVSGIDLLPFLNMCSLEPDADGSGVVQFFETGSKTAEEVVTLAELKSGTAEAILVPDDAGTAEGMSPVSVYISDENGDRAVRGLRKIMVSAADNLSDPHYGLHLREPLDYMQDMEFTVNFIDRGRYPEIDEDAEAFKTITFTMKEIEEMIIENPDQVFGNYFGISGNESSKHTVGLGGFSDYFEGLSMSWLLREKAGLRDGEGSAAFYGRDGDFFGQIDDLSYFFPENDDYSRYYLELTDTVSVDHVVPVLAVSKNGYPLLPEHDHGLDGNVDYNIFNQNALDKGFETEIGLVKNVSGPFIAALANLDGVYGGYRNETSGDCIRIDFYVDASLYDENGNETSPGYSDVPEDSWYAQYVKELTEKGVVSGKSDSAFEPDAQVTRAEFVKMIAGVEGADVSGYSVSQFDDVKASAWYAPYVAWAVENDIVQGVSGSRFCPDAPITRQDMAVVISRYADNIGLTLPEDNPAVSFADAADISAYASEAVTSLQRAGILSGKGGGLFAPKAYASRAEACKIMWALMEQMK